jgi:hypothetical protein
MISIEKFIEIRERFGHFASWAIWADEGANPKDNIDDLSVLNPDVNPRLLKMLHGNEILSRVVYEELGGDPFFFNTVDEFHSFHNISQALRTM